MNTKVSAIIIVVIISLYLFFIVDASFAYSHNANFAQEVSNVSSNLKIIS